MTEPDRLILARYQDISDRHSAAVADIGEEFAAELAKQDALAAERAREAEEARPAADAAKAAAAAPRQPEEEQKPAWERPERQTLMTFGGDELREQAGPAPVTTPIPAQQHPFPPPPAPESPRPVAPARYLSFGGEDEEALAPPPPAPEPPKPPRRAVRVEQSGSDEPDDDDLSGHSWLRR
ncbi:hypothetical protein ACOBQX_13870 [Actinokineospora sp. G85]|uniref:hypothetical protein n=1 Tax=Actinokineospora sp. G85 TaxID=3406626 RepID=UPI003C777EFD